MRPNAKNLAMRDPALAALMGAIGESDFGSDFGAGHYGSQYGWEDTVNGDEDDMGWEDFGADAPLAATPAPTQSQLHAAWNQNRAMKQNAARREQLLYPNKNSHIKIEGYEFALSAALVLGTASAINASDRPTAEIRPRRVTMNAPAPGFVTFTQLQVANINTLLGGISDAFGYNANGSGQGVSYPTLNPSTPAAFAGAYSGLVPTGYAPNAAFIFVVEFKGPAAMTA